MISGYSDEERVRAARDLGVTEFIAKPFRIDDIISHVEAAVRDQRRYVKAPDYFGPDRRRQLALVSQERRGTAEDTASFFEAPRRLFSKVGGELSLAPDLVESAQRHVDDLHRDFADWVQEDLRQLDEAFQKVITGEGRSERASALATMCRICHELRGQGGVFGYPLVTDVAESLFKLSNNITAIPEDGLKLIRTHIDLLRAIVREDVSGDGGRLGQELMGSLRIANLNFINKPENKRMVNREFARLAEQSGRSLVRRAVG